MSRDAAIIGEGRGERWENLNVELFGCSVISTVLLSLSLALSLSLRRGDSIDLFFT